MLECHLYPMSTLVKQRQHNSNNIYITEHYSSKCVRKKDVLSLLVTIVFLKQVCTYM